MSKLTKKKGTSSYSTEEWRRSQEENMFGPTTAARRGNAANYAKDTRNLSSKGYPSSTEPTSQPKKKNPVNLKEKGYPSSTSPAPQPSTKETLRKAFITNPANVSGSVRNVGEPLNKKPTGTVRNADGTQTKKRWNAEEEMRNRKAAAKAQGKGNWNAEEEMRKRREAAMAKKKGK